MSDLNRSDVERIVRKIISKHLGEPMAENLFKDTVDQVLKEHNESISFEALKQRKLDIIEHGTLEEITDDN
ncbi:MAG: hypothetical protein V3R25_09140 [Nitrosomonadaceae bacterium]